LVSSAVESLKSSGFDNIKSNDLKLQIINHFNHAYNLASRWINVVSLEKFKEFKVELTALSRGKTSIFYNAILQ